MNLNRLSQNVSNLSITLFSWFLWGYNYQHTNRFRIFFDSVISFPINRRPLEDPINILLLFDVSR
jgi:ammonia channel protein AmtB